MKRWIPLLAAFLTVAACKGSTSYVDLLPDIYPDYIGVTVPAGIAPMDFNLPAEYDRVLVQVTGSEGGSLKVQGKWARFPLRSWRKLTEQNVGGSLLFTVLGRKGGQWTQWRDFVMYVSEAPLTDYGVTYRKIAPGYTTYSRIGLYQRDIHSFKEEPIIESTLTPGQCMNCHTANATDPSQFLFHLRGKHGATLVQQDGHREWGTTKTDSTLGNMAYCYWHPEGRWLAGSINPVRQCFWTGDQQPIEVFDTASDLVVMDLRDHSLIVDPRLTTEDWLESSPAFTPDGKTLYFCKAKAYDVPRQVDSIRYDGTAISLRKTLSLVNADGSLRLLGPDAVLHVGDRVRVHIDIYCERDMDNMVLVDQRAAAFEPVSTASGWQWNDGLHYYVDVRAESHNCYVDRLNEGRYYVEYDLWVRHAGTFEGGIGVLRSVYAPEFRANTPSAKLRVAD